MLKVFLVEDEMIIRNAIKKSICWEKEGYEFVGEAGDGEMAYPMIQRLQPDIVITDIKMPFMDGLELSELVRKNFPHIKIMVLSGHDDFSYAQRAIQLGVAAYLLKPIHGERLLEEMAVVADRIYMERQTSTESRWRQEKERKAGIQELFVDLVSGKLAFRQAMERGAKYEMDFIAPYFQIMHLTLMEDGVAQHLEECHARLSEYLEGISRVRTFEMGVEGWYLILLKDSDGVYDEPVRTLENGINEIVSNYENVSWFAGVGPVVERLQMLGESYRMASKASAARFFLEKNQVLKYEDTEGILAEKDVDICMDEISTEVQVSIEKFLRKGFTEEIEGFVNSYLNTFGKKNLQSLLFRQYVVMNGYFSVHSFLKETEIDESSDGEFQDIIRNSMSLESTRTYLQELLQQAILLRDHHVSGQHRDLMQVVLPYIHKHHREDSLSLNRVAAEVHVSPSYLSKIFSEEMGCGFIEYLTSLRIESAKELLLCTNTKVTNIAFEIGYRDSGYFCQLFKKNVGCTMKEYRNRTIKRRSAS